MIKRNFGNKKLWYVLGAVLSCALVIAGVLFVLEKKHVINFFRDKPIQSDAQTTSQAETAQADFSDGDDRQPTSQSDTGTSSVADNNGVISPSTPTNSPIVSTSGEISVYTPAANAFISSGQELSGTSTLSSVSYRVIDDVRGVTSSGELTVVNGKFSGSISFETSASQGRIDIFGARADGTEFSNVEIPVRFK